ncbi:hypothetical protein FACS189421_07920 [Bacteroidia bacterium]|nr:hypothetical protein FACS189421_07920 [Bacteroidia bacterium]GHT03924.1 hypothetical protein FACS189423_05830 [Bacteroidia bacterium]
MKANATQYTGTDGFVWAWHGYAPGDENNSGWNALPAGYARKNGIGCGWGSMTYYIAASTNMDPGTFGQIGLNYQSSAGVSESGHSWESENQFRVRCVLN